MVRFFVERKDIIDGAVQISGEDLEHIRVVRLRPDELFAVCDGEGNDYICRLGAHGLAGRGEGVAEIVETRPSKGEPTIGCSVYVAYAKGDRLEYAVQKSVELGAREIVLFPSERCVSIPSDMTKKIVRFQRIATEAAKQSGRGYIPRVIPLNSFRHAIEEAAQFRLSLFLYECEEKLHLKQALDQSMDTKTVSIVTGPEGGFEPHEAEFAKSAGMTTVTLGPRILRCETAPIAALTAVMYHTGNM